MLSGDYFFGFSGVNPSSHVAVVAKFGIPLFFEVLVNYNLTVIINVRLIKLLECFEIWYEACIAWVTDGF